MREFQSILPLTQNSFKTLTLICIFRGLSGNKGKVAFRKWYSCLREIRSLVSAGLPIIALTATASKRTKQDEKLHFYLAKSNFLQIPLKY